MNNHYIIKKYIIYHESSHCILCQDMRNTTGPAVWTTYKCKCDKIYEKKAAKREKRRGNRK